MPTGRLQGTYRAPTGLLQAPYRAPTGRLQELLQVLLQGNGNEARGVRKVNISWGQAW